MTTETKKQTLLEKYKDKLEFAKEISSLSSDQKQFLFNKDFQEAFDKITGFVADKVVTNGQSQAIKYKYASLGTLTKQIKDAIADTFYYVHYLENDHFCTKLIHNVTNLFIEIKRPIPEFNSFVEHRKRKITVYGKPYNDKYGKPYNDNNAIDEFEKCMDVGSTNHNRAGWETFFKRYNLSAIFGLAEKDENLEHDNIKNNNVNIKNNNVKKHFSFTKAPVEEQNEITPAKAPVEEQNEITPEMRKDANYIISAIEKKVFVNLEQIKTAILNNSIIKNKQLAEPQFLLRFEKYLPKNT